MITYSATCETCARPFTSRHEKQVARSLTIHSCQRWLAKQASAQRRLTREAAVDKAPKPCRHKQARHVHGTHACYVLDQCRCPPCTGANTAYEQHRSRLHAYGRFGQKWVDAAPAREHVLELGSRGLGLKRVVELSGYSQGAMAKLVYGAQGREPTRRILRVRADAILAVRADISTLAGGARLDGTGTRRRLRALMAIGWSGSKLARRMDYEVRNFCVLINGGRDVTARTARTVRAIYDELWNSAPPRASRGDKGAYTRSRNYARARGWPPPLAYDEDTIDDPGVQPAHDMVPADLQDDVDENAVLRRIDGDRVTVTRPERMEVVRRLNAAGLNDREIVRRTGLIDRQVLRDRQTLGIPAVTNARTTPARTTHAHTERKSA